MAKVDKIKGGLVDKLSLDDIAKKHKVSIEQIKKELAKGIKVELEHTSDKGIAKEIATDHLVESPTYYTNLIKMEKSEKVDETYVRLKILLREALIMDITDETADSTEYIIRKKGKGVGVITLGPCNCGLGKDTIEIIDIQLNCDYSDLKTFVDTIKMLWKKFPETNRFVIEILDNVALWEKVNATRLNDTYYMINRGH